MKKEYNFYRNVIKPIEKKYNRMCLLYSFFHWNYFKNKKVFYNKLLILYYRMLKSNYDYLKTLEKDINT